MFYNNAQTLISVVIAVFRLVVCNSYTLRECRGGVFVSDY
jgi:hypothetical protein